jgi:hypothetical protein
MGWDRQGVRFKEMSRGMRGKGYREGFTYKREGVKENG